MCGVRNEGMSDLGQKLMEAAFNGTLGIFTNMAKTRGWDLKDVLMERNHQGETFLFAAAENGHLDQIPAMAKTLNIDLSEVVNAKDRSNYTFIHSAALSKGGKLEQVPDMVEELGLDISGIIDSQGNYNRTFLHHAAAKGRLIEATDMAKRLGLDYSKIIDKQSDCGDTFLHHAATCGHLDQIPYMVKTLNLDLSGIAGIKNVDKKTFLGRTKTVDGNHFDLDIESHKDSPVFAIMFGRLDILQKQRKAENKKPLSLNDIDPKDPFLMCAGGAGKILGIKGFSDNLKEIKTFWEQIPEKAREDSKNKESYQAALRIAIVKTFYNHARANKI